MGAKEEIRRRSQSWRARGFTVVPNLLIVNPSLPPTTRLLLQTLHARSFGKGHVKLGAGTIARDLGVSRQTVGKHLNILKVVGLVEVVRRGRGLVNVIRLVLAQMGRSMKTVFERVLPTLSERVLDGRKRTVAWWMERWRAHREARAVFRGVI